MSKAIFTGFNKLEGILLSVGIFFWTVRFINYPPIVNDEASRILTIQQTFLWDLMRIPQLDSIHDAKGFLALPKIFSLFLPVHELSFRLPVFLCALLGCFLFFRLSREFLTPSGRYVAMGLYIICPFLVWNNSIMSPYAIDMFYSTLIFFLFLRLYVSDLRSLKICLGFACVGGMALVSSLPAVFILAGCSLTLIIHMSIQRETEKMKKFLPIVVLWAGIWILYYLNYVHPFTQLKPKELGWGWLPYLLPLEPGLDVRAIWLFRKFAEMFQHPVGVNLWLGIPLWVLGVNALCRLDRVKFFLIISPFFMMLIAVLIRKYPFHERVLAFLLPMNLLFIGRGYQYCVEKIPKRRFSRLFVILIGCLLFIRPLNETWKDMHCSHRNGGVSSALEIIRAHWQTGDGIYIYLSFRKIFRFLNQQYRFRTQDYRQGACRTTEACAAEMKGLPGYERIWFILCHDTRDSVRLIRFYADHQGKLIYGQGCGACYLYLYEWDSKR